MGKIKPPELVIGKHYRKISKAIDLVTDVCDVNRKELKGSIRVRQIVDARRIYAVLCREFFGFSLKMIGNFIKKDHATILYYINQHKGLAQTDSLYRHNYNVCAYALENCIKNLPDDGSYIDAVIAENKLLRTQNQMLEQKLEAIQQTIEVI